MMRPDGICWLPVIPQPARSMTSEKTRLFSRNFSCEMRQPAPTAGKVPQRLSGPRFDEPSRRSVRLST